MARSVVLVMGASSGPWFGNRACLAPGHDFWPLCDDVLLDGAVHDAAMAFWPPALWKRRGPQHPRPCSKKRGSRSHKMGELIAPEGKHKVSSKQPNTRCVNSQAKTWCGQQPEGLPDMDATASLPEWLRGWT